MHDVVLFLAASRIYWNSIASNLSTVCEVQINNTCACTLYIQMHSSFRNEAILDLGNSLYKLFSTL